MPTIERAGILEIDPVRGVIYFHDTLTGRTILRICHLPTPIPNPISTISKRSDDTLLDLTWGFGCSWKGAEHHAKD